MYSNIGKKIKALAVVTFLIIAIPSVIGGVILATEDPIGILLIIGGPLVAWITSWFTYGFGEIIDKLTDIERNTRGDSIKSATQQKIDCDRITQLEKLRAGGLITEEEYQRAATNRNANIQ